MNTPVHTARSRLNIFRKRRDRAAAKPKNTSTRADIQGLRAFAVIAVVLDHLLSWPSGGFVGVDVFFVISGFLITGLLMREWERSGEISFAGFYGRRIKRILPASLLVIVVTVALSFALFGGSRARSILIDGTWATLFSANWRFASVGTDYFQLEGPVSPLQHYWSLAVEEQFYFAWPWIMLAALILASRVSFLRRHARATAGAAIAVISLASFMWALTETSASPTVAYYSTLSRTWELGLGALLALASPVLRQIPNAIRPTLAWTGLAAMVASLFVITPESAFPAPSAALPVLATGLVIASGTGGEVRSLVPLTNPVARYLGDISFSLYLWHFPIIILGASILRTDDFSRNLILIVAMLATAVFAFHLVEDPIRRSAWLMKKDARSVPQKLITPAYKYIATACLTAVTLPVVMFALNDPRMAGTAEAAANYRPVTVNEEKQASPFAGKPELGVLQADIAAALTEPTWPELDPSIDNLGTVNWQKSSAESGCSTVEMENPDACMFGDPASESTAVILGDSHGMAWTPGLTSALVEQGYRVQALNRTECPAADVSTKANGSQPYPECDEHHIWSRDYALALEPDLIILASTPLSLERLASGSTGPEANAEYQAGLIRTIEALQHSDARIVILQSPPIGPNLTECYTAVSTPGDCDYQPTGQTSPQRVIDDAVAELTGVEVLDSTLWFCTSWGACPAFVGTTPVRADMAHLTVQYSERLAPVIKEALLTPAEVDG